MESLPRFVFQVFLLLADALVWMLLVVLSFAALTSFIRSSFGLPLLLYFYSPSFFR